MIKVAKELDVYSGLAIIFVLFIHADGYYLTQILHYQTYAESGYFLTAIDKIIHGAVPMFIFIAGFKHQLNYKQVSYNSFFKKRISKVLIPFLFVSLFFMLAHSATSYLFEKVSISTTLFNMMDDFVKIFMGYNRAYQLWYIPLYLFIVLTYPLITRFLKDRRTRFIMFGAFSITYVLISSLTDVFGGLATPFNFVYYFIFFELGCYVSENRMNRGRQYQLFCSYLIVMVISIFAAGSRYEVVITDLILVPISVCGFYYFSVYLKDNQILAKLGIYSFYIFLFHDPIFLSLTSRFFNRIHLYKGYPVAVLVVVVSIFLSIIWYKLLVKIGVSKFIFFEFKKSNNQKAEGNKSFNPVNEQS